MCSTKTKSTGAFGFLHQHRPKATKITKTVACQKVKRLHHCQPAQTITLCPAPSTPVTPVTMRDFFLKTLCLVAFLQLIASLFLTLAMRDQTHCGASLLSGGRTANLFLCCQTFSLTLRVMEKVMERVMTNLGRSCQAQLASLPGLCRLPRGRMQHPVPVSG